MNTLNKADESSIIKEVIFDSNEIDLKSLNLELNSNTLVEHIFACFFIFNYFLYAY